MSWQTPIHSALFNPEKMKRNYFYLALLAICLTIVLSCKKTDIGYLSNNLFYSPKLLEVPQGSVFYSSPINVDQSTIPLTVKLLSIRNKATGVEATDLLKEYEISTFSGEITDADSTLALLNAKIVKSSRPAFHLNESGGRLEFTQATANVDTGMYVIDVQVTNPKGTTTLLNICDIHLAGQLAYTVASSFSSTSPIGVEADFVTVPNPVMTVDHDASGPNKIIIKVVDKNGVAFSPANNEVILRGDRGNFAQMNPYYPVVKTSTGMEWGFPVLPNGFPIKLGSNGDICYYRVPGAFVTEGKNVNLAFSGFKVYVPGTFTLTLTLPTIIKK